MNTAFKANRAIKNMELALKMSSACVNSDLRMMQLINILNGTEDYFNEEPSETIKRLEKMFDNANITLPTDVITLDRNQFDRLIEDILAVNRQKEDDDEYPCFAYRVNAIKKEFTEGYFGDETEEEYKRRVQNFKGNVDYHDCNRNPLWYHKLIRPFIRYKHTSRVVWEEFGMDNTSSYYVKRRWYKKLWEIIDKIKKWRRLKKK